MRKLFFVHCLLLITLSSFEQVKKIEDTIKQPVKLIVDGVELHYIEQGQGEPLILLHGGQGDYRSWPRQLDVFASKYRVISYSRRYHYPNSNVVRSTGHSALVDADLRGFYRIGICHRPS